MEIQKLRRTQAKIPGWRRWYVRCKITSPEVTLIFLGRIVIRFSDISNSYLFVFIRKIIHFIIVNSLERFYKYDDREKAMYRYLDFRDSEASVSFGRWTLSKLNLCSYEVKKFADLCTVNCLFKNAQTRLTYWVTLLKILANDNT